MMIIVDKPLLQIKDLRKGLKLKTPHPGQLLVENQTKLKKKKPNKQKQKMTQVNTCSCIYFESSLGFWFSKIATNWASVQLEQRMLPGLSMSSRIFDLQSILTRTCDRNPFRNCMMMVNLTPSFPLGISG